MKLAQIKNGIVVNVAAVDPKNIPDFCADWPEIKEGGKGWTYDGKTFTAPVEAATDMGAWRETASLPRSEFAIRAAQAGIITDAEAEEWAGGNKNPAVVLALIGSLPKEKQLRARIRALSQVTINRNDGLIVGLEFVLKLKPEQVDVLFGWVEG